MNQESLRMWKGAAPVFIAFLLLMVILVSPGVPGEAEAQVGQQPTTPTAPQYQRCSGTGCECRPESDLGQYSYCPGHENYVCDWQWSGNQWNKYYCLQVTPIPTTSITPTTTTSTITWPSPIQPAGTPAEPEFKECTDPNCECLPREFSEYFDICPGQENTVCGYDVDDSGAYHPRVCLIVEDSTETPAEPELIECTDPDCECLPDTLSEYFDICPDNANTVCGWYTNQQGVVRPRICMKVTSPCPDDCECLPREFLEYFQICPNLENYVCDSIVDDSGVYHPWVCLQREVPVVTITPSEPELRNCTNPNCECLPINLTAYYPRCPEDANYVCGWDEYASTGELYPRVCLDVSQPTTTTPRPTITQTCPLDAIWTPGVYTHYVPPPAEPLDCSCEPQDASRIPCWQSNVPCGWEWVCPEPGTAALTHLDCGYRPLYCYWDSPDWLVPVTLVINTPPIVTLPVYSFITATTSTGTIANCPDACTCRTPASVNESLCYYSGLPCGYSWSTDLNQYVPMYCYEDTSVRTTTPVSLLSVIIALLVVFGWKLRGWKQSGA